MNQNFPHHFSEHSLRVFNQYGWIHATSVYTNGIGELREANLSGWIHATAVYANSIWELRKSNLTGWFYATVVFRNMGDKAGFHATEPIVRVDEQP